MLKPDVFLLPAPLAAEIVRHAQQGWPEEVCGLLAGSDGQARTVHRGRNVSPTPRVAYELDAETLALQIRFEDEGQELVAIYHSHPAGPTFPSETDLALAAYPDAVYIICSLAGRTQPALRGYRVADGQAREVFLQTD